jgi:hypothetical protein
LGGIVLLVVVGTAIWVGIDANNLGVRRGRLPGSALDMSIASWVVCCLLLWIVAFPCYLVARGKYQAMQRGFATYGNVALAANAHVAPNSYGVQQPGAGAIFVTPPAPRSSAPTGVGGGTGDSGFRLRVRRRASSNDSVRRADR